MKRIGFWFYVLFLCAALFFGFLFVVENPAPVSVVFVGIPLRELSLGVWLLLALLAGVLLTLVLNFFPSLNSKRKLSNLERQKQQLTTEITALKEQGIEP